jgi:hypothetical protein
MDTLPKGLDFRQTLRELLQNKEKDLQKPKKTLLKLSIRFVRSNKGGGRSIGRERRKEGEE